MKKQMLLSILILGTTATIALGMERTPTLQKELNEQFLNAAAENNFEKVSQLLNAGADINAQDTLGETALHKTVSGGKNWLSAILMEKGIDTKIQNKNGETAAHYAADKCNCAVLEFMDENFLLHPTIRNNNGEIPLNKAQIKHLSLQKSPDSRAQNEIYRCQRTISLLETTKRK